MPLSSRREEIDRFLDHTERLKSTRGADGRRAFAVPVDFPAVKLRHAA